LGSSSSCSARPFLGADLVEALLFNPSLKAVVCWGKGVLMLGLEGEIKVVSCSEGVWEVSLAKELVGEKSLSSTIMGSCSVDFGALEIKAKREDFV